jgi:hypothetical protein
MTDTVHATGGCQCGAVRYAFLVPPENSHVCHCRMCQRAVGNVFAALVGAPKDKIIWSKGSPTYFASSNLAQRGFCNQCGTPLTYASNLPDGLLYVTTGSLDAPDNVPIIKQYGIESRVSWVDFCEDVPMQVTDASPEAKKILAGMISHQG